MRALIAGSSGYAGELLLRLLLEHPSVEGVTPVSFTRGGEALPEWVRYGAGSAKLESTSYADRERITSWDGDVLFSALPHLKSAPVWRSLVGTTVVIDLAADARLKGRELFRRLYGVEPPLEEAVLKRAVYGLTELAEDALKTCDIIANPGCYPTATLLPLVPLVQEKMLVRDISIAALSGTSGAGRGAGHAMLLSERAENSGAYAPGAQHRHWGELCELLPSHNISFVPHVVPMARGLAATIFATVRSGVSERDIIALYAQRYGHSPFVCPRRGYVPQTADVRGSNRCDFSWRLEGQSLIICSVIDNLLKGASGQAVQNMNVRFGIPQERGLPLARGL